METDPASSKPALSDRLSTHRPPGGGEHERREKERESERELKEAGQKKERNEGKNREP